MLNFILNYKNDFVWVLSCGERKLYLCFLVLFITYILHWKREDSSQLFAKYSIITSENLSPIKTNRIWQSCRQLRARMKFSQRALERVHTFIWKTMETIKMRKPTILYIYYVPTGLQRVSRTQTIGSKTHHKYVCTTSSLPAFSIDNKSVRPWCI